MTAGVSSISRLSRILPLLLVAASCSMPAPTLETTGVQPLSGGLRLTDPDLGQSALRMEDLRLRADGTGFVSSNGAQGLQVRIEDEGAFFSSTGSDADWMFGISTVALGANALPATTARLSAGMVEMDRGDVTEYWTARPDGYEHSFLVDAPTTEGDLVLHVAVDDATVELVDDQSALLATETRTFSYDGLAAWDAAGTPLDVWFEAEAGGLAIVVDDTGALYPVTVDPTLASRDWTFEVNKAGSHLGNYLGFLGDINADGNLDLGVGAKDFTNGENLEGRGYGFFSTSGAFSTTSSWRVESNQANAYMGTDVVGVGDVNGDGKDDVLVGAPLYDNGQTDEGVAFLYLNTGSSLPTTPSQYMEANVAGAQFGASIVPLGDINSDGFDDVAIGAPRYTNGETNEGAVYVFLGAASGLTATPAVTLESNRAWAWFGYALATGDVNGDTYTDLVVTAPQWGNGETKEGRALIYYGTSTSIGSSAGWTGEINQANAVLGYAACVGDVDNDGYDDVVVGSHLYDNGATDEGALVFWAGSASGPGSTPDRIVEANQAGATFGLALAVADVNADGFADVLAGAPNWDGTLTDEGASFLYPGTTNGPALTSAWSVLGEQAAAYQGMAVAIGWNASLGDFDLVTAAPYYDNGSSNEGAVFLFQGVGTISDVDGDGYAATGDCDDTNDQVNPGAAEVCDGIDNDCDGDTDEAGATGGSTYYADADSDMYGDASNTVSACSLPSGFVLDSSDCDDTNDAVNPAATEVCDAFDTDEDCDGLADDDDTGATGTSTFYYDGDGDGDALATAASTTACDAATPYTATTLTDCDDANANKAGSLAESEDNVDNDCDDIVDDGYRGAGDLVVTEMMYISASGTRGQWVEIYNPGSTDLVVDGLRVDSVTTTGGTRSFYIGKGSNGLTVPAGDYAVLCFDSTKVKNSSGVTLCDYAWGSNTHGTSLAGATYNNLLFLANSTSQTVRLSVAGTTVDEVVYSGTIAPWPTRSTGYAIELSKNHLDASLNGTGSNWCKATTQWATGSEWGTPNSVNVCSK